MRGSIYLPLRSGGLIPHSPSVESGVLWSGEMEKWSNVRKAHLEDLEERKARIEEIKKKLDDSEYIQSAVKSLAEGMANELRKMEGDKKKNEKR